MNELDKFGWQHYLEHFPESSIDNVARVINSNTTNIKVQTLDGLKQAKLFSKDIKERNFPVVGDWVRFTMNEVGELMIEEILPRFNKFSRKASGGRIEDFREQLISANIDYLFVMTSPTDFSLNRLERYTVMAKQHNVETIFLINKSDTANTSDQIEMIKQVFPEIQVFAISSIEKDGFENLTPYLKDYNTISIVGSSGVGKSTFINSLFDESIRETSHTQIDGKGRHTTTDREMFFYKETILIDNPGMRVFELWNAEEGFDEVFEDIKLLISKCHFNDCTHESEPGCMIQDALENGFLEPRKWKNFQKLKREMERHEEQSHFTKIQKKSKMKKMFKEVKRSYKFKREAGY